MSKAFDEWWATVQGDDFGKRCVVSAVRTGWNAAIEAAAKELEENALSASKYAEYKVAEVLHLASRYIRGFAAEEK